MTKYLTKEKVEEVLNFFSNLELKFFHVKHFSDVCGERGAMTVIYDKSDRICLFLDNRIEQIHISVSTDKHEFVYMTRHYEEVEKIYNKIREYESPIIFSTMERYERTTIINPTDKMPLNEMDKLVSQLDEILSK